MTESCLQCVPVLRNNQIQPLRAWLKQPRPQPLLRAMVQLTVTRRLSFNQRPSFVYASDSLNKNRSM